MDFYDSDDEAKAYKKKKKLVRQHADIGSGIIAEMFSATEKSDTNNVGANESFIDENVFRMQMNQQLYCVAAYQPSKAALKELGEPFVAVGGTDGILRLYSIAQTKNPADGNDAGFKLKMTLPGHTSAITALKIYHPKGAGVLAVISGSADKSVRVWVVQTESCFLELRGNIHKAITCIDTIEPDDLEPLIIGGDRGGNIVIWSMLRGEVYRTLSLPSGMEIFSLISYIPRSKSETPRIIAGAEDGGISIWSLETGNIIKYLDGHASSVHCLDIMHSYGGALSEDSQATDQIVDLLASGSKDKSIIIWEVVSGIILRKICCHSSTVFSLKLVPIQIHRKKKKSNLSGFSKVLANVENLAGGVMANVENLAGGVANAFSGGKVEGLTSNVAGSSNDSDDSDGEVDEPTTKNAKAAKKAKREDAYDQVEYVEEVAIVSAGKDTKVSVTSLNTGGSLYTLRHHEGCITGVAIIQTRASTNPESDGETKLLRFNIPGRSEISVISVSTDKQLVLSKLDDYRDIAYQAYIADKNGFRVADDILVTIPDQFRVWPHVYMASVRAGLSLEEFFSHDSIALFQQAIIDKRSDFVEIFLAHCPLALAYSSRWFVNVPTKVDFDIGGATTANTRRASDADSMFSRPSEVNSILADDFFDDLHHSALEEHAKSLLVGGHIDDFVTTDMITKVKRNYALHGITFENDDIDDSMGVFKKQLFRLNRLLRLWMHNGESKVSGEGTFSLLTVALEMHDGACISAILNVWARICNTAANKNWIDQISGPFTRLKISDLVDLAAHYPVVFENFICDLKLQPAHPYLMAKCTKKIPRGKEFVRQGGLGHITQDMNVWHDSLSTDFQHQNFGYYLPLVHCVDISLLGCYNSAAHLSPDIRIFQSDLCRVAAKFSWSNIGLRVHIINTFIFFTYFLSVQQFAILNSVSSVKWPIIWLSLNRLIELNRFIWSNDVYFFFKFGPLSSLITDAFVLFLCIVRLREGVSLTSANFDAPERFFLSVVALASWIQLFMKFRPFTSTGPIIATIFEILYDIRNYVVILGVMLAAYTMTFWTLCSSNLQSPFTFTLPFSQSYLNASSHLYDPPEFEVGQASAGEPGAPYNFDTVQQAFLTVYSGVAQANFAPSTFDTCGIGPFGTINAKVRNFAIFLQLTFCVLVPVLMTNILIAIMSDSYQRLSERGKSQVLMNQAQIVEENSFSITWISLNSQYTYSTPEPKLVYLLSKNADLSAVEIESDDVENEQELAKALHTTEEFAERMQGQYAEQVEETEDSSTAQVDTLEKLRQNLDALNKLNHR